MKQERITYAYKTASSALNRLYGKRKRTLFFQKVMWSIMGLYLICMLLFVLRSYMPFIETRFFNFLKVTQHSSYMQVYLLLGFIIMLYPVMFFFTRAFQTYKKEERAAMNTMVKLLFPEVEFAQTIAAPRKEIAKSNIFAWVDQSTIATSYGQIRSITGGNIVNIADVGIMEKNTSNTIAQGLMHVPVLNMFVVLYNYVFKNIVTQKTADTVQDRFRGMFCWLDYPQRLQGHTLVLTNNMKHKIDRFARFQFTEEQKVLLEDVRFTKKFMVYGTDQIEARYVLSASLMERIVALEDKFKRSILMSFHNQKMYVAVENRHGLFSFSSEILNDIKIVEELTNEIETALHISEHLKLNTHR